VGVHRYLFGNRLTGTLPTELGTMDALTYLCVRRPHASIFVRRHHRAVGQVAVWGCRNLNDNRITGPLPTELGTMDALRRLCVHRPHPPRLDACALTRFWLSAAWRCAGV
jgi:hypothetical protein